MPYARPYNRLFNFLNFQRDNPSRPAPADRVDSEFNEVKLSLDSTQANLKKIQRADGYLADNVVTKESLAPSLSIGFTFRGLWQPDTNYVTGDGVAVGPVFYRATTSHLAAANSRPDLAPSLWQPLADFTIVVDAAQGAALLLPGAPVGDAIRSKAAASNPAFTGTGSIPELEVGTVLRIKSNGKTGGVLQAGNGLTFLASVDPNTGQLVKSIVVTTDGVNFNGPVTGYEGGTLINPLTYGGGGTAAGYTSSANGLLFGVPNYIEQPTVLSTYASRDHAAWTRSMKAPVSVLVPGSGTTYTATSVSNPALTIDANIKIGMVIDTQGAPRYSGAITAINAATKTLTVNGWYRVDGSGQTGTPSNGTGALINPASKLWISNDILVLGESGKNDVAGAGTELNISVLGPRVVEVYGFDAVPYGTHQPDACYGFAARWGGQTTRWRAAMFGQDNLGGLLSVQTAGTAYATPLLETRVGSDNAFTMDHMGKMTALRLRSVSVSANTTLDRLVGAKVIGTQSSAITIVLPSPSDVNDGREIEVVNYGSGPITVNRPNGTNAGTVGEAFSQRFFAFQNNWLPISKTPIA